MPPALHHCCKHSGMRPAHLQLEASGVIWFTLFLVFTDVRPHSSGTSVFLSGLVLFVSLFFSYIVVGGFTHYLNIRKDFSPLPQEFVRVEM